MDFKEYQKKANSTAIYPKDFGVIYPTLGLNGEAGEVAEKIKKVIRDQGGDFTEDNIQDLKKELGDVLWYIAALCKDLGLCMEDVAEANIKKLFSRKERGVITGKGDDR